MKPHSDRDHIGYLKETKEDELVTALKWCDEHLPVSCTCTTPAPPPMVFFGEAELLLTTSKLVV